MDSAWIRANQAVAVYDFKKFQLPSKNIALLVTAPGCEHCATFETEYAATAEERASVQFGASRMIQWSCDTPEKRQAAIDVGVDDVPCVVVIWSANSGRPVEMHEAFQFAKR